MFSNYTSNAVGFASPNNGNSESTDSTCQTTDYVREEKGSETQQRNSSAVQTDEVKKLSPSYNDGELAAFLQRVCPAVIEELDKVEKTKAFQNYRITEEYEEPVSLLHVLSANHLPQLPKLRVSCLSWNCTGTVLALAFETPIHDNWCVHESAIYFYNTTQYKFDGFRPNRVIATASCITALSMHPFEPSVVAAGTQGGEVQVWSLLVEGPEARFSNTTTHNERVTKIEWITLNNQLFLITSSLDSYMFTFKVLIPLKSISLNDKFVLNEDDKVLKAGVTTFAFAKMAGVFVAGLEGGELLHCSAFGATPMARRPDSASTFKKPVLKSFGKLLGPVITIQFSPYNDNLFVTAHTENKFIIRSLVEGVPLKEIHAEFDIVGACWSPSQANAIFAWGSSDKIIVYNSDTGNKISQLRPENEPDYDISRERKPIIYFTGFNPKRDNIIALSSHHSKVYIWEVPKYFKV